MMAAEAISVGTPVIAMAVGGPRLTLRGTGYLVRPGPALRVVRDIAHLLDSLPIEHEDDLSTRARAFTPTAKIDEIKDAIQRAGIDLDST
jgi:glycosyltransferase involved in cell wall biosynthesis